MWWPFDVELLDLDLCIELLHLHIVAFLYRVAKDLTPTLLRSSPVQHKLEAFVA